MDEKTVEEDYSMREEKEELGELVEKLEESVSEELEEVEEAEDRVGKEIALHHRDLHTAIKKAAKSLKNEMHDLDDLKSSEPGSEEAVGTYKDVFNEIKTVDEEFAISTLTTIAILRYIGHYYLLRKKFSEKFEEVGKKIEGYEENENRKKEIDHLIALDEKIREEINRVIEPLAKATHSRNPPGPLIKAATALKEILEDEGVKSWVTRRIAGSKKTAAKEERIE